MKDRSKQNRSRRIHRMIITSLPGSPRTIISFSYRYAPLQIVIIHTHPIVPPPQLSPSSPAREKKKKKRKNNNKKKEMPSSSPRPPVSGPDSGPENPFPIRLSGPVIQGFGRGSKEASQPPKSRRGEARNANQLVANS